MEDMEDMEDMEVVVMDMPPITQNITMNMELKTQKLRTIKAIGNIVMETKLLEDIL
jgi:hypothetical protein